MLESTVETGALLMLKGSRLRGALRVGAPSSFYEQGDMSSFRLACKCLKSYTSLVVYITPDPNQVTLTGFLPLHLVISILSDI